jgi:hypothetical protein
MWLVREPSQRAVGALGLLLACLVLVGCSKPTPTGEVSGKVTYKGHPLTSGSVNFHSEKGIAAIAPLDSSGNYKMSAPLEVGTYKVYLSPPIPEQLEPGKMSGKKPPFDVPPMFQDLRQTPISKDVKAGPNDIPIDLDAK